MGERLLVKFSDGTPSEHIRGLRESVGAEKWERDLRPLGWRLVILPDDADVDAVVATYRADPAVIAVERDRPAWALFTPADPLYHSSINAGGDPRYPNPGYGGDRTLYGGQWNLDRIRMPEGWDIERGHRGVVVAVIDTGVLYTHPDLADRCLVLPGSNFTYDNDNNPDDPFDTNIGDPTQPGLQGRWSHGTSCAGIIAATVNGIGGAGMADVTIMPVKVLDSEGGGNVPEVIAGILFAADNGAHIISMSLGLGFGETLAFFDAIQYAHNKGCLLVAASGNSGHLDPPTMLPGARPEVLAVTAFYMNDRMVSLGNGQHFTCNYGADIDLCAPGWYITTCNGLGSVKSDPRPNYTYTFRATSSACPHVAGAAALLWSKYPGLTARQVATLLRMTARDAEGAGGRTDTQGYGMIDVAAALTAGIDTIPAALAPVPQSYQLGNGGWQFQIGWTPVAGADGYMVTWWLDDYGLPVERSAYLPPSATSYSDQHTPDAPSPPVVYAYNVAGMSLANADVPSTVPPRPLEFALAPYAYPRQDATAFSRTPAPAPADFASEVVADATPFSHALAPVAAQWVNEITADATPAAWAPSVPGAEFVTDIIADATPAELAIATAPAGFAGAVTFVLAPYAYPRVDADFAAWEAEMVGAGWETVDGLTATPVALPIVVVPAGFATARVLDAAAFVMARQFATAGFVTWVWHDATPMVHTWVAVPAGLVAGSVQNKRSRKTVASTLRATESVYGSATAPSSPDVATLKKVGQ